VGTASYALRAAALGALVAGSACVTHLPASDASRAVAVTLRDEGAEYTIDPATLAVASRGVSLSGALATPMRVAELSRSDDRLAFRLPDEGLEVGARIDQARLTVRITSSRAQSIAWPRPSSRDVRAIALPIAEGLSIPPTDPFWQARLSGG
jgi:hypothetical protein